MEMMDYILIAAGYLSGSVPWGLVMFWLAKKDDVRKYGSGNIGATNVARNAGLVWGLSALVLDILKGLVPILVSNFMGLPADSWTPALVAIAAVFGHMFPVWLSFKGGKGVATAAGVFFGLSWSVALVAIAIFAITFGLTRIVSLSSICAAVGFAIASFSVGGYLGMTFPLQIAALIVVALIVLKHHENIVRLLSGTEKKLKTSGGTKDKE